MYGILKLKDTGENFKAKWSALASDLEASGLDEKWSKRQKRLVKLADAAVDRNLVDYLLARHGFVNFILQRPRWRGY